jgi:DNA-binding MarR family transcriptional regulator
MTRPLTQIGLSVKRLQHRHHRSADAALAEHGISLVQWDALRHIDENPGASLHDLAQLTFQSDQAFGTLTNRMVERGLITRVAGPGRAVRHQLTARGQHLRKEAQNVLEGMLRESFAALTAEELEQFDVLLEKLLSRE